MGAAFFYQLTESPLEPTLLMLLGKAREAGWRIEVRGTSAERMALLDAALWRGAEASFLPHGQSGGPHDDDQPILLTLGEAGSSGFDCVMTTDQAEVRPDEVVSLERVCILFDGADAAALAHARGQWKTLTNAGCSAQYWAQDSGRWTKKAEK